MVKMALLIGVSEYESGLPSLPAAVKDAKAIIGIVVGIATALVLTVYFSGKPQNSSVTSQPKSSEIYTSTSTSTNHPTVRISAKELYDSGVDKYNKKDYKGAIEYFNEALYLDSNNLSVAIYNQRGYALLQLGKYTEAINDFNYYIQNNPNEFYSRANRAWAFYNLGKYQQAIDDYSKALEINSSDASSYYSRGNAYSQLGQKQKAIKDYQKAAELYQKQGKTKEYQDALDRIKENK